MHWRAWYAVAFGLAILATMAIGSTDQAIASKPISTQTRAALLKHATRVATLDGDPHPYDVQVVSTTAASASQTLCGGCATSPGEEPVYLLAMRGRFHCNTCKTRPGERKTPSRSVIALALTAGSLQQTTFSLSDHYPNLGALGTPVRLDKRQATAKRAPHSP
jgi:hypothetical protein